MTEQFIPGETRILYGGVSFGREERAAIEAVLDSNWWGIGEETRRFEEELALIQGVKRAVFVNSGTSALDIGFRSLGLKHGSEIIVPACTFPTPVASLIREGLRPVVADVDLGSYFISPDSLERSITSRTSAVFLVYVSGAIGELDAALEIAQKYDLTVIEDNCDSFGGTWNGKMIGSFGKFSAISTHAAHIISTGAGGVMLTDDDKIADIAVSLRDWGRSQDFENRDDWFEGFPPEYRRYTYTALGSNYQPLELQAAMGRVQLRRLEEFKDLRQRNFDILTHTLVDLKNELLLPTSAPESNPCWYTFPIVTVDVPRRKILDALDKNNIEWRPILAGNIAFQPGFRDHIRLGTKTPNADRLISDGFWVSVNPRNSEEAIEFVGRTIRNAVCGI